MEEPVQWGHGVWGCVGVLDEGLERQQARR